MALVNFIDARMKKVFFDESFKTLKRVWVVVHLLQASVQLIAARILAWVNKQKCLAIFEQ